MFLFYFISNIDLVAIFFPSTMGDGRNDGINRLYFGTVEGCLYEYTYNSETTPYPWDKTLCAQLTVGAQKDITWLKIYDGKNDGINRIYASCYNGNNYEFFYNSESDEWETSIVDNSGAYPYGIIVGDTRNDGTNRILTHASWGFNVNEITWNGSWNKNSINYQPETLYLYPGDIGNGRNDDTNRIYLPDYNAGRLWEYSWNQSSSEYDLNYIYSDNLGFERVLLGDARGDGITRIYASQGVSSGSGGSSSLVEMEYNGSTWDKNFMYQAYSSDYMRFEMQIGKTQSDDRNRLYSLARRGALVEHEYSDDSWEEEEIDVVSGATSTLIVGDARNDNIERVYISGRGSVGRILEYTHPSMLTDIESNYTLTPLNDHRLLQNYPNPFNPITKINYELRITNYEKAEIVVFNSLGQKVWSSGNLPFTHRTTGDISSSPRGINHSPLLFDGSKFNSGIYYYSLVVDGKKMATKSMVLIK